MSQALNTLALSCLPLAMKIAGKFIRNYPHLRDDLEGEALYALVRASRCYEPGRAAFTTFAGLVVERSLIRFVQYECRRVQAVTIDKSDEVYVPAKVPAPHAALEARDVIQHLPRDVRAAAELIVEGYGPGEVAEAAGLTRQGVYARKVACVAAFAGLME